MTASHARSQLRHSPTRRLVQQLPGWLASLKKGRMRGQLKGNREYSIILLRTQEAHVLTACTWYLSRQALGVAEKQVPLPLPVRCRVCLQRQLTSDALGAGGFVDDHAGGQVPNGQPMGFEEGDVGGLTSTWNETGHHVAQLANLLPMN
jgi:hypothetical protein